MPEEEFKNDYLDKANNKPETENQVDKFSQTTKLLDKELKDKKGNILKILEEGNLREIFENLLSSEDGELCIMSLLECGNNEEDIKNVILSNLPEGYAYNISTNEVVKTEVKKTDDYTGAMITDKKGDEAVHQEDEAVRRSGKAVESQEIQNEYEIMMEALGKRRELTEKYINLDSSTNENSDNYQKIKNQLENNGVLKQLKESGHNEQFINDYILVQTTLVELKSNPTSYEKSDISFFDKLLKNLDNACNIPDTSLSSFSSENITQTRMELFNKDPGIGNDSLKTARDNNMDLKSHKEAYDKIFSKIGEDKVISKYGNLLQGELKAFWEQYQNNYEIKNKFVEFKNNSSLLDEKGNILTYGKIEEKHLNLADDDKRLLKNYDIMRSAIIKIEVDVQKQTKKLMEEMCIISQIKGMYMCMGEGDDFNLNKAKEIQNKNGILTLRGHIDGVDFAIRQDTTKEEPLQTSTKLAKEKENRDDTNKKENFVVGGTDKFIYSKFILPTQNQIFDTILKTVSSDSSLENSNNQEEYLAKLQTNIMGKMEEKYEKTKHAHLYMKEQVKGEKIIDKTISFIENIKGNGSKLDSPVSNSNEQLYNFLHLMDYNIRYSTSVEKDRLYKIMDKINRMSELALDNPTDGELENHKDNFSRYLTGDAFLNTRKILNGKLVEGESNQYSFDLFKKYKREGDSRNIGDVYMINFDQMLIDLRQVETQKKDDEDVAKFEKMFGAPGEDYPQTPSIA